MPRSLVAAPIFALAAAPALAGGLDRTGQPLDILFADGNYAELGFAGTVPSLSGSGAGLGPLPPGFSSYDDVGDSFFNLAGGVKMDFGDRLSAALIVEQPFGANIDYPGDPAATELGGTYAHARSTSLTALLRYRATERFSLHGGVRVQRASGEIGLSGLAYGPFNGYEVALDEDIGVGYVLGVAYEIPDIALRVALTYNSEITHELDTVENFYPGTSVTEVTTPQSVNLDVQTGIAEDTLLFGSVRWAEWSTFLIDPAGFASPPPTGAGAGLVDLVDTVTYEVGLGRRFSDAWAGSAALIYEPADDDDLVSPLAPTNGFFAVALGASYTAGDVTISGGARYTWLGDAMPETGTPDVARADFADNTALSFGLRVGFNF